MTFTFAVFILHLHEDNLPLWLRQANQSNNNHFKHTSCAFLCICQFGDWNFSFTTTMARVKLPANYHLGEYYWKDFSTAQFGSSMNLSESTAQSGSAMNRSGSSHTYPHYNSTTTLAKKIETTAHRGVRVSALSSMHAPVLSNVWLSQLFLARVVCWFCSSTREFHGNKFFQY